MIFPRSAESLTVEDVILSASINDNEDCAKKVVCLVNTMDAAELSPRYCNDLSIIIWTKKSTIMKVRDVSVFKEDLNQSTNIYSFE